MDKPKNKPPVKAPVTGRHTEVKAYGFPPQSDEYGRAAKGTMPETIDGTHHMMRMGLPENNTNTGNEHLSIAMQAKGKKDANRRKRGKGRS
jgi:hypothetical protein